MPELLTRWIALQIQIMLLPAKVYWLFWSIFSLSYPAVESKFTGWLIIKIINEWYVDNLKIIVI